MSALPVGDFYILGGLRRRRVWGKLRPMTTQPRHTKPATPTKTAPNPRAVCLRVLGDILTQGHTLDTAFGQHAGSLSLQNKNLAYAMAAGTLRSLCQLDKIAARFMQKPFPHRSPAQNILRIGIYQLLYMDGIKDHAALSATVELAKQEGQGKYSGVINGVLRNIQRSDASPMAPTDALPGWLYKRLKANGYPMGPLAEAMLTQAPLDIHVYKGNAPETAHPLEGINGAYRLPPQSTTTDLTLNTGNIYVQDYGAGWPATLLMAALPKGPQKVLDMCAAPGGKTLQLAANIGAENITAIDMSPKRLMRFHENMAAFGLPANAVAADGLKAPFTSETFDAVLLDAPCTATGTTRRHPEVMHLRQPADLTALGKIQRHMLQAAASLLKPGGVLVYAVCSLLHYEGENQDTWAQANLPLVPLALTQLPASLAAYKYQSHGLRLLPPTADGFFIAVYQKQA